MSKQELIEMVRLARDMVRLALDVLKLFRSGKTEARRWNAGPLSEGELCRQLIAGEAFFT